MRFKRNHFQAVLVLVLAFMLASCAAQKGGKSLSEMSDKEKSVIMMDIYNQQFTDYMTKTGYTKIGDKWEKTGEIIDFTEDQKDIMRKKKEILTNVYPLITLYDSYVANNRQIDLATEQQIFALLDELVKLVD